MQERVKAKNNMYGALTLPSVSTGFTSDSKSMVPVSIQGMADKVTKMSPLESMQEVFFDIRDGIGNLAITFGEKISGLNSHLAFRLETLNQTMSKIGNIAAKDLGIEKQSFDIIKENEAEDERNESLSSKNNDNGANILDTLKDRFNGLIDLLSPKSELGRVGLLGALTLGIVSLLPKLEKAFEGIFEFTGEKLIPFIDSIFDIKDDETGEFKWDRILGLSLGAYLAAKVGPALLGLVFKAGGLRLIGLTGLAVWATASAFQAAGDWAAAKEWNKELGATDNETLNKISGALAGDLEGGIMNAFKNASKFAGIGAFTGFMIGGPVGALVGGVIGGAVGGILGWIGGGQLAQGVEGLINGVKGIWNNVTQGISDFFNDREIMGPGGDSYLQKSGISQLKDDMMENFRNNVQSIKDFFYDEKGNLFGLNFGALTDMLPTLRQIADTIVSSLPKWMRPDTLQEKIDDKKSSIAKREDELSRSLAGENVYLGFEKPEQERQAKIIAKEKQDLAELENEMKQTFPGIETSGDLVLDTSTGSSISSGKELKTIAQIRENTGASSNITIAPQSYKKDGDNYAVTQALEVSDNPNSLESTGNKVLDNFYAGGGL